MYARGTILERREPFVAPDPDADPPVEGDPRFAYNEVRVVGESPIAYSGTSPGTWEGVSARGVIVEPLTAFGGTVDRPLGELQEDYFIKTEAEPVIIKPEIRVIQANTSEAGPTPEEVFADAAAPKPRKSGRRA